MSTGYDPASVVEITPVRRRSLASAVAHDLSCMILSGKFAPGERLPSYGDLAARFQVSVSTIREAISALVRAGALDVKVGQGTFVRTLGAEPDFAAFSFGLPVARAELVEFTEARCMIDEGIAKLAAERRQERDLERLRALLADMESSLSDPTRFMEADLAMHIAVAEAARNRPLLRSMLAMLALMRRNIKANIEHAANLPGMLEKTLDLKREWVEAIAAREPDRAAAAIAAMRRLAALTASKQYP